MGLFSTNNFERMTPDEFLQEAFRLFDIRLLIEKALEDFKMQEKLVEVSDYKPRFDQQMMVYSYHQVIDISQFSKYKTMEVHITPRAEFGKDKYFKFERELLLDVQPVKDRKIADKVTDIYSDLG